MAFSDNVNDNSIINNVESTNSISNVNKNILSPANSPNEVVDEWHLSGRTCAPSSATIESKITLKIDVTSFSESSGAGDTVMYFIVSGMKVHTVYVGGTGVYTYTYTVDNTPGNINFHAEYLSGSEFFFSPSHHGMVMFRNSYSDFGDSNIHIDNYLNYIGYDGNNTIYLSNEPEGTAGIYNINLNGAVSCSTFADGTCRNVIIGEESYKEVNNGGKLYIWVIIGESGAGNITCAVNPKSGMVSSSYPDMMTVSVQMSGNGPKVDLLQHNGHAYGMNVTSSGKALKEENDMASLMLDGMSLIPYYGYAVTAGEAAATAYNLIHCLTSNDTSSGNNHAEEKFYITGGSYTASSIYAKAGQNVYSAGTCAYICIPDSDLSVNRTLTIKYQNCYVLDSALLGLHGGADATDTINAVTASAIYGCIEYKSNGSIDKINHKSLYIEDVNNGNFYKVPIKNGRYLFFAEPNNEYKIYYNNNGNFKLLKTIDASNLTAGSTYRDVIFSDEL